MSAASIEKKFYMCQIRSKQEHRFALQKVLMSGLEKDYE